MSTAKICGKRGWEVWNENNIFINYIKYKTDMWISIYVLTSKYEKNTLLVRVVKRIELVFFCMCACVCVIYYKELTCMTMKAVMS